MVWGLWVDRSVDLREKRNCDLLSSQQRFIPLVTSLPLKYRSQPYSDISCVSTINSRRSRDLALSQRQRAIHDKDRAWILDNEDHVIKKEGCVNNEHHYVAA